MNRLHDFCQKYYRFIFPPHLTSVSAPPAAIGIVIIRIIIINDNVCGAVLMTMVTARVHPVHLMNAD